MKRSYDPDTYLLKFLEFLPNSPSILQVGTVLNVEEAKNAINSGAKFLMSPAIVKVFDSALLCF